MKRSTTPIALASVLTMGHLLADDNAALTGYVLADNGMSLMVIQNIIGDTSQSRLTLDDQLDALAFRPVTGELLGFSRSGYIYTIDPETGSLENQQVLFSQESVLDAGAVAFDFNNTLDAARLVGASGANLVYFPDNFKDDRAGKVLRFNDVFYAVGDRHEGIDPLLYANAYTNAITGRKAKSTFQYAFDARTDALVSLDNNAGTLSTINTVNIGGKPVDLVSAGGLDIVSSMEGENTAYALLRINGADTADIYRIDLRSAEAIPVVSTDAVGVLGFAVALSK